MSNIDKHAVQAVADLKAGYTLGHADVAILNELARIALASIESDGALANEGTITATQFKPVADLYGLTSPTGGETSFTFDAIEARDFIDGGWSCQEYVEIERYQESVAGNSPVTPDGYVLVPVEPTEDMIIQGFESEPDESFSDEKEWEAYDAMSGCQQAAHRAKLCWAAMIAASQKS
ncbi:TPA: hypothetical protein N5L37_001512 [Enterobacter hormaechei subsp. steigerwaltii]|nr:hypothetical protein [Enterobacter hormaechei subsp. steigerwaltii]